jgi:predicted small integral membrane protein
MRPSRAAVWVAGPSSIADVIVWAIICSALVILGSLPRPGSALGADSVQYLSVASNFREGLFGYTSLVYYDAERSFGTVPAPMVTFPLGYPAMIAAVSSVIPNPGLAGFAVSALATIGTIFVLWAVAGVIGLPRLATNALLAICALNQALLVYAGAVMTEALFTVTALSGVALLLRARRTSENGFPTAWVLAGIVIGLSYHVRYAGLFFVIGLFVLLALRLTIDGYPAFRRYGVAAMTAALTALPSVVRNLWLVGNWRGGNEKAMHHPVPEVLYETARGLNGVIFGLSGYGPYKFLVLRLLFIVLAAGLLVWLVRILLRSGELRPAQVEWKQGTLDISVIAASYAACMFYAGVNSVIHYGARMFVPLVPIVALLVVYITAHAMSAERGRKTGGRAAAMAILASLLIYAFLNLFSYAAYERASAVPSMERIVESRDETGRSARSIALELASVDGVLVANEGQVLGHVLGTRIVSLADPHWSTTTWDEQAIRTVLETYDAAALLIVRPKTAPELEDLTEFQIGLSEGSGPTWLRRVFRSDAVAIYVPSKRGWAQGAGLPSL